MAASDYSDPVMNYLDEAKAQGRYEQAQLLRRWRDSSTCVISSLANQGLLRSYLNNEPASQPNMTRYLANYARARLVTENWKDLPLTPPESDVQALRGRYYGKTLNELRQFQAGIIGGFALVAGQDPVRTAELMQRQLADKLAELDEILSLSLEKSYTPTLWLATVEQGGAFDDYDELNREERDLTEPVDLYEELLFFAWGVELTRAACASRFPEVGLPNIELFNALMTIDLNALNAALHRAEPRLKRILRHMMKYQGKELYTNQEWAPEEWWWRHWRPERKPRTRSSSTGQPRRRNPQRGTRKPE